MVKRCVTAAELGNAANCHTFRTSGVTTSLLNGGTLERPGSPGTRAPAPPSSTPDSGHDHRRRDRTHRDLVPEPRRHLAGAGPGVPFDDVQRRPGREPRRRYCQVDEKLVELPPRYWARASREPAMLGIRNGRQPQLDNTSGKGVTAVGTVTPVGRSAAPPRGYSNPHFASVMPSTMLR